MFEEECSGAGIIIYYDNRDGNIKNKKKDILYLFLVTGNNLDFPKGHKDHGEYPFDCATRETKEECGLSLDIDYSCNENLFKQFNKGLVMYLGKKNDHELLKNIEILPNTSVNPPIKEHDYPLWLSKKECLDKSNKNKIYDFLVEPLNWAEETIKQF
tara:strand:+ start:1999 stop:2469 length:471 start_codon:yes stop_codon:yes gene_type:complete